MGKAPVSIMAMVPSSSTARKVFSSSASMGIKAPADAQNVGKQAGVVLEDAGHHHQGEGAGHQLSKHHEPFDHPLGKNFSPRASSTQMTTRGIMLRREHPPGSAPLIRLAHTGEGGADGRGG